MRFNVPSSTHLSPVQATLGGAGTKWMFASVGVLVALMTSGTTSYGQIMVGNEVGAEDIAHSYYYDDFEGGTANDFLVGGSSGVTAVSFTANLSSTNTFTYTMSAPDGMAFFINPVAEGRTRLSSNLRWTGASYNGTQSVDSVSFSFADLTGTAPGANSNGSASISKSGGNVIALQLYSDDIVSAISFTSLSITMVYSDVVSESLDYTPFDGNLRLSSSGLEADPGELITIAAVPEPSTFAGLLGLASLAYVGVCRRNKCR